MTLKRTFVVICFNFLTISFALAQVVNGTQVRDAALSNLISRYDQTLGDNSHLYNGPVYINRFEASFLEGHQYFVSPDWQSGFVHYDGSRYDDVALRYDLFTDKLIAEHSSTREIELITDKIKSFGIAGHVFVWLKLPEAGFYELIYNGDTKVYAHHYKTIQEKPGDGVMVIKFLTRRKLYIYKSETFYSVGSKGSALKVFGDQKSELKKFLNRENIVYSVDKEYALGKMAEYADQISKNE